MKYLSIINSVLEFFEYHAKVEVHENRHSIRVYFLEDVTFLTENLLSSLMSIGGLHFVAVNFNSRSITFIY